VVDYSSPNTAKRMHVGHLRSMVIGEALQRLVRFVGAKVIRDNHLGDWGTQFGILIAMIKEKENVFEGSDEEVLDTLESLYREGNRRVEEDVSFGERARQELVKLQHGDPFNETLWKKINHCSYATFQAIYDRMGVAFDKVLGESFYRHDVESVCRELQALGIAEEDQGALVVFHREHARYATQPFIVRKSDGASNYASTDLATARYRTDTLGAQVILNVTDGRQRDHFECLALTVEKWFKKTGRPLPQMHHVWFGMVQDVSGKAIKTRTGVGVRLHELLDEAVERAYHLIQIKSPDLSEEEKRRVAEAVGLGAIKYADLAQERTSNYVFDGEKMMGFDGNTAPYLLYAVARIYALFRKLGCRPQEWKGDKGSEVFAVPEERRLACRLMGFPGILALTLEEFKPHWLCRHLFDLAGTFSGFYNAHKVVTADEVDRNRRLLLCQATLSTLECGLHLLGLETVEKM
jgi:arginyl-tRNA synthetase